MLGASLLPHARMDLALNSNGDLDFASGDLRPITDATEVGQRIALALGVQVGEWTLALDFGTRWRELVFTKSPDLGAIRAEFEEVIEEVEGVDRATVRLVYDPRARTLKGTFVAVLPTGATVEGAVAPPEAGSAGGLMVLITPPLMGVV